MSTRLNLASAFFDRLSQSWTSVRILEMSSGVDGTWGPVCADIVFADFDANPAVIKRA